MLSKGIKKLNPMLLLTGGLFGLFFSLLMKFGNPPNMGVCVVCFIRDIGGAIGFHSIAAASYIRPEIIGFIVGATIIALLTKEFKATGGSSPIVRFIIGVLIAVGALVFLGCPIRMFGRIAGGDWIALMGLAGLIAGAYVGSLLMKKGYSLGKVQSLNQTNAWIMPVLALALLVGLLIKPSVATPGTKSHAPILISLVFGLIIGFLAHRSRFCSVSGIRDIVIMKNFEMVQGIIVFVVVIFIANLFLNQFHPGSHPIAHTDLLWSALAMVLVGMGSVMIGGCPFRQTILTGQGDTDAGFAVLGIFVGAAFVHNCPIAASPAGIPVIGKIAVIIGIVVLIVIGLFNIQKNNKSPG